MEFALNISNNNYFNIISDFFEIKDNKFVFTQQQICETYNLKNIELKYIIDNNSNPKILIGICTKCNENIEEKIKANERKDVLHFLKNRDIREFKYDGHIFNKTLCNNCLNILQNEYNKKKNNEEKEKKEIEFKNIVNNLLIENYIPPIKTFCKDFDNICGEGIKRGTLTIVGGLPGSGKNAFLNFILENFLKEKYTDYIYISLYHSCKDIIQKFLINKPEDIEKVNRLYSLKNNIKSYSEIYISNLVEEITYWQKNGKSLFIIDDIQRIKLDPDKNFETENIKNKYDEVTYYANKLKEIALKFKIAIICVSQLNNKIYERDNRIPKIEDIRDSGSIGYISDYVIFIYRPFLYDDKKDKTKVEILIEKNKFGKKGKFELYFNDDDGTFKEK